MAQLPDNGQWGEPQRKDGGGGGVYIVGRVCPKNPRAAVCNCWREQNMQHNVTHDSADTVRGIERRAGNRLSTRDVGPTDSTIYRGGTREPDLDSGNVQLPLMYPRWGC
jgi:hypothetical protein